MKKIAVIDPFMVNPALSCFNRLVDHLPARLHYHHPQKNLSTLETYPADAYIVLGSASHVYHELPWHGPLGDFILKVLHENKPVLGICFGHQLMCHRFGGKVEYYISEDVKLTGTRAVTLTQDVFGLKAGTALTLPIKHKQVVKSVPDELEEIGRGLPFDIVRHKTLPFLGTQPHPEASVEFCATESSTLTLGEVQKAQSDGLQLITAFFRHHDILA